MPKKVYYEDNWLNQHLDRVGLLDRKKSMSDLKCNICESELTLEEEENLAYTKEQMCHKCKVTNCSLSASTETSYYMDKYTEAVSDGDISHSETYKNLMMLSLAADVISDTTKREKS